ncbi:MAG TPA: BatD family protein [Thermoanaerobaculia bacterium]|nr:BatD family protein [Thermoanaerobaculia bacterium]
MRTMRMNDLATITVAVEGSFAENDYIEVPLQNLAFVGEPSVSSEFSWTNGVVMRRKVFRYRVRPVAPGAARVGPVELNSEDGQVQRLPPIALTVLEDRASSSNDAQVVLRELLAAGREPFFVIAETDKTTAFTGEAIVVTWVMYNAAPVQQWQVVTAPKLADFWTEELPRDDQMERLYVGDVMVQRTPIRRVALFPLRSGRLRIEGMIAEAALMRRTSRGPFSLFQGEMVEATFTSAPIDIDVKPLPDGPPPDAVGDLTLQCERPIQRGSGPVVLRVALTGLGNVRAAVPPRFEHGANGTVQIEGGEVSLPRDASRVELVRRWSYMIFPAESGTMEIPALRMSIFAPSTGLHRELRCAGSFLDVVAAKAPAAPGAPPPAPPARDLPWQWIAAGAALLVTLLAAVPRFVRELRLRREAREIVQDANPSEIRARMESRVKFDLREASDRGDAWRALRSLLDAADKERDIAVGAEDEILRRVRELLRTLSSS